jgi:alkylation response protein AidB-like acyl-CoA dehydrogenase
MEFELDERQKELKKDITDFCLDPENRRIVEELAGEGDYYNAHSWELFRRMAERGWISLNWPTQYGGKGYTPEEMAVFHETMAYLRMPLVGLILTSLVGNVIAYFGSDRQKGEFLPRAAAGELLFCLLYTEPDAGSDLSALQTRAEEDGEYFVINGSKVFTSLGHLAHYGLLAARTDPGARKREGISLFLVPLNAEGVTINPIYTMGDGRVNEEVFVDVRVHRDYMIGEKNGGWLVLTMALGLERGSVAGIAAQGWAYLEELQNLAGRMGLDGDPLVCQTLAKVETALEVSDLLNWQLTSLISKGGVPVTEAAMAKLYSSEAMRWMSNEAMNVLGFSGLLKRGSPGSLIEGATEYQYQMAPMVAIGAGSTEIMQGLIARAGLGLAAKG